MGKFSKKMEKLLLEYGFSKDNECSLKKHIDEYDVDVYYDLTTNYITVKAVNNMLTGYGLITEQDYKDLEKSGVEPFAYVTKIIIEQVNNNKQEFIKQLNENNIK